MLQRSIPDYIGMREAVHEIGAGFLMGSQGTAQVADLGCSTGGALEAFLADPRIHVREFLGVEESPDMIAQARRKLARHGDKVRLVQANLVDDFPRGIQATVILCVLTMQFIPVEHRVTFLNRCRESLAPGGALILVEKLTGQYPATERHLRTVYEGHKERCGYTREEIEAKRKSLSHIMTCLPATTNESLIHSAGFRAVEGFWRRYNFAGWFAVP